MPLHLSAFAAGPGRYMRTTHLPFRVFTRNGYLRHDLLDVKAIIMIVDTVVIIGLHT